MTEIYQETRVEFLITVVDKFSGNPEVPTGTVRAWAKIGNAAAVEGAVSVAGNEVRVVFDGTLAEPGGWQIQVFEFRPGNAAPEILYSDVVKVVRTIEPDGI